jgi:hypothetical protein
MGRPKADPKHKNCKKQARVLVQSIKYKLYQLSLFGKDKCPKAGVSYRVLFDISTAVELMDRIRLDMDKNWKDEKHQWPF